MASCDSFPHIFDTPLPEMPSLIDSLSPWNQIISTPIELSSFTEMFGELHFRESHGSSPSPLSFPPLPSLKEKLNKMNTDDENKEINHDHACMEIDDLSSNSSKNSENQQLCTEGLGSESVDDADDLKENEKVDQGQTDLQDEHLMHSSYQNLRIYRRSTSFPPPISSIGSSGKPWVCYKSYRHDGRFVLKEVRIPSREFLHACREDGRLKLHLILPKDEFQEDCEDESDAEYEETDADYENNEFDAEERERKSELDKEEIHPNSVGMKLA